MDVQRLKSHPLQEHRKTPVDCHAPEEFRGLAMTDSTGTFRARGTLMEQSIQSSQGGEAMNKKIIAARVFRCILQIAKK